MRLRAVTGTLVFAALSLLGRQVWAQQDRWEPAVSAFEAADRVAPPPHGEVVFVGSSSIQRWNLISSFPELATINRGIDGTELRDFVRYAERIILPYQPRLVVVYAGDNDIASGKTPEQVATQFDLLLAKIRARLPNTRIAFIGLKPSIQRWALVEQMRATNALVRARCAQDDLAVFIDVDGPMLGWDEKPRPDLFVTDGLHLSADGYQVWAELLRPFLKPLAPAPVPLVSPTAAPLPDAAGTPVAPAAPLVSPAPATPLLASPTAVSPSPVPPPAAAPATASTPPEARPVVSTRPTP